MSDTERVAERPAATLDTEWACSGTSSIELANVFPLPLMRAPPGRGRRATRRLRHARECNETLEGLNWFAGFMPNQPAENSFPCNAFQEKVWARVDQLVYEMGPPSETPSSQAAFQELLRGRSVYGIGADGGLSLATFRSPSQVSMSDDVASVPSVLDLVPDSDHYFGQGMQRMLRTCDDYKELCEKLGPVKVYTDRKLLASREKYLSLIRRLVESGLFRLLLEEDAIEQVSIFFVIKKGKALVRLVIDARASNRHFVAPPGVSLCSTEGMSRIEVQLPEHIPLDSPAGLRIIEQLLLSLGVADVADAFHRMRIPKALSRYFCLPAVSADELGLSDTFLDGVLLRPGTLLVPAAGSLPMGFSWSLFFCQQVTEKNMKVPSQMTSVPLLRDRAVAPVFDAVACQQPGSEPRAGCVTKVGYVYVDNLGILGAFEDEVAGDLGDVCAVLDNAGLTTHERAVTSEPALTLGAVVDGGRLRSHASLARLWKVRRAFTWALRCRRLPGRVWEALLGHATFLGLADRGSLAAFSSIYGFIHAHYWDPCPLWRSARTEVRHFLALLPLLVSDWTLQWCSNVVASDASLSGFGVCVGAWTAREAGTVG